MAFYKSDTEGGTIRWQPLLSGRKVFLSSIHTLRAVRRSKNGKPSRPWQLLLVKIQEIYKENPDNDNYGVGRILLALTQHGTRVSRSSVRRAMQTLADKSPSHISEMLIIGSNMGVINAVKNLKKYQSIEPKIVRLMEKLLKFEENNIQQLKEFL